MAIAYEKMGAGFYFYAYADNKQGTTLMAFDPMGAGYCAFADTKPRLTSRHNGGTFSEESGTIVKSWTTSKKLQS